MNKTLKWVLYILLGLIGVALIGAVLYTIFGGFGYGMMMRPDIPWYGHMRVNYSPWRLIFGGLLCLGVVLLVILGIVALISAIVRGNRPAVTTQPSTVNTPEQPCSNCGRMTEPEWKNCPYCGNPLT